MPADRSSHWETDWEGVEIALRAVRELRGSRDGRADRRRSHRQGRIVSGNAATKRPFQGLPRKTLEALYMGALETITELETKVVNEITNEPGTSWEITDGNLHIRVAS